MQAVATGSSSCPFLKNVAQQSNSRGVAISMARNILTQTRAMGTGVRFSETRIIATAVLDRLLHHSTTINFRGESYRL